MAGALAGAILLTLALALLGAALGAAWGLLQALFNPGDSPRSQLLVPFMLWFALEWGWYCMLFGSALAIPAGTLAGGFVALNWEEIVAASASAKRGDADTRGLHPPE